MGWLASFLVALLLVSALALAMPALFGPLVAGIAPLLVVIALIGLGGVWWRHSQHRIDPEAKQPDADAADEDDEPRGENERVET